MGIIIYIIFGALVGWVASEMMDTGSGLLRDIVVGIVGSPRQKIPTAWDFLLRGEDGSILSQQTK